MTPAEQVSSIQKFLSIVHPPGSRFEVRGLNSPEHGTLRMYTGDTLLAARAAATMSRLGADVYYTLNPIRPDSTYAREARLDTLVRRTHHTSHGWDALARTLYLIDIDPIRENKSTTASTDAQLAAALVTADRVEAFLASQKMPWPRPIRVMSGNGIHLLYRGDGCVAYGKEASDQLRDALQYLASQFAEVDTSVYNAGRISRMPLTLNTKANRFARVLSYPEIFMPVKAGAIYQLSTMGGLNTTDTGQRFKAPTTGRQKLQIDEDDIEALIDDYDAILELEDISYEGDVTFFFLSSCPFNGGPHRGQDRKTAIILYPNYIHFHCFSDDCEHYGFMDLVNLLGERTGERPDMVLREQPTEEELSAKWGGIDDLDARSRTLSFAEVRAMHESKN